MKGLRVSLDLGVCVRYGNIVLFILVQGPGGMRGGERLKSGEGGGENNTISSRYFNSINATCRKKFVIYPLVSGRKGLGENQPAEKYVILFFILKNAHTR